MSLTNCLLFSISPGVIPFCNAIADSESWYFGIKYPEGKSRSLILYKEKITEKE